MCIRDRCHRFVGVPDLVFCQDRLVGLDERYGVHRDVGGGDDGDPGPVEGGIEVDAEEAAAVDVGRVMNPILCAGQVEGGTLQAIGWALTEKLVTRDGKILNPRMTNYIVPTSLDAPPFTTILVEAPYSRGPGGAKGVGELPMDGGAPAVAAAIEHATGLVLDRVPLLPEDLFEASLKGDAR